MNESENQQARIVSLAVVGVLALFAAFGLAAATGSWQRLTETIVFLCVLGTLLSRPPFRMFLVDGLVPRTALLFLFVGAAVVAQFGGTQHLTFPFVSWRMFPGGVGGEPIRYINLDGVLLGGEVVTIQGPVLFPSLQQARYQNLLEKWTRRARDAARPGSAAHEQTFEDLMRAIARAHNSEFPAQRLERLEVAEITLSSQGVSQQHERKLVWTIEGPF